MSEPVKAAAKTNWGYSLVVWLVMVAYLAPLLVAWNLWDPLDYLPYFVCFGAGVAVSIVVWQLGKSRAPASFGLPRLSAVVWAPFLAIGVGLGANVLLDSSPTLTHAAIFLGYQHSQKGPMQVRFSSWRKSGTEEHLTCNVWRSDRLCPDLKPGDPVAVGTHRGALGWEWVDNVARR